MTRRHVKTSQRSLASALKRVRLVAMDVDGVLTDAGMYYSESGDELKKFNTRDGMGIKMLQAAGFVTAFITKEKTAIVERRGQKLAVPEVHQGIDDKLAVLTTLAQKYGLSLNQVAYIGDDVNDLEALLDLGRAQVVLVGQHSRSGESGHSPYSTASSRAAGARNHATLPTLCHYRDRRR